MLLSAPFAQQPWRIVASPTPLTRLPTAFHSWSFRSPVRRTSATVAPPTKHAAPPLSYSSSSPLPSHLSASSPSPSRINTKVSTASDRATLVSRHISSTSTPPQQPPNTMSYTVRKIGQPNTLEHRVYIEKDGVPVSPFHDIPLYANEQQNILNMIVEIPRWTNAKQEVCLFPLPNSCQFKMPLVQLITNTSSCFIDLQGGVPQPHQAGCQEGQAPLRP